jgi:hypothetical protein
MSVYRGFKLDEYENPEKVKALVKYLRENGDDINGIDNKITENDDTYTIDERQVLHGKSPARLVELIAKFKSLLSKSDVRNINKYLENELYKEKYWRNDYYTNLKPRLPEDEELKRQFTYVENILYHLLDNPYEIAPYQSASQRNYIKSIQAAWFGQELEYRELSYEDSGEYRVLTDSEADSAMKDYVDEDMWKQAVEADQTTDGFEDWRADVINMDGRGSLAFYDSEEREIEIDGETYYIYRVN